MNGRVLAGRLAESCPDLRVLYVSGCTAKAIAHRGIPEEGVDFRSKPVMRNDLAAKVEAGLGKVNAAMTE